MPVVFTQPPLIEIVAEFRWAVPAITVAGAPSNVIEDSGAHDLEAMNFAARAGVNGFTLIERTVPPGFPLFAGNVAVRYRKSTAAQGEPLFQLGPGILTVNITPPYKSWSTFFPFLEMGVDMLLLSRTGDQKDAPFTSLRLRYIDAFGDKYRQGKSISEFLIEHLGVEVKFPDAVMQFCANANEIKPAVSVSIPIDLGSLRLNISERFVRNVRAIVMDTTVICQGPIEPKKEVLLAKQNAAHDIIHKSFVGMTKTLHELMMKEDV